MITTALAAPPLETPPEIRTDWTRAEILVLFALPLN